MLRENLKYKKWNCYLQVSLYPQAINKNIALVLRDMEDDGIVAKVTVNPEHEFPQNYACIKDYSENEGMLEWAKKNNIVIKGTQLSRIFEPCLKVADDIYQEYLKVLDSYKKYEGEAYDD